MSHLTDIAGCRYTAETDAEAEDKTACEKHSAINGWCLDTCADDDNNGSGEHPRATAPHIIHGACQEDSRNRADVVHRKDDSRARPGLGT